MDAIFETHVMSKSEQVRSLLLEGIKSGRYPTGSCMPSDNELSAKLGLSRNTVREAISSLVSKGYLVRIQGKGTFVTEPVREQEAPAQRVVAVAGHDVRRLKDGDPFLGEVLQGVHSRLAPLGWGVALCPFDGSSSFAEHVERNGFSPSMKQGLVFAGYSVTEADAALLKRERIPAASIGKPKPDVEIPYVECDHFLGAAIATRHLIGFGHKRIAFFDNCHHEASSLERQRGWRHAIEEAGLAFEPKLLGQTEHYEESGLKGDLEKFLSPLDFTALLAYGDVCTLTVLKILEGRGLKVPDDFSICAYSNYAWMHHAAGIQVASVYTPVISISEKAASLLVNAVEGKPSEEVELVKPRFSPGSSCAPPPGISQARRPRK